jgi:hypothetical protein
MVDTSYYAALMRRRIAGRPWLATADTLVGAAAYGRMLLNLGAERVLAIGGSRGAGVLPDPQEMAQIDLGCGGSDFMTAVRASEAALAHLPPDAWAQVDAFDPAHEARVVAPLFSAGAPVAGRRVYGARPASWQALEDKTLADALWDATGVERAPSAVAPPDLATLMAVSRPLDQGLGTVWSGDAREGFNGGASYVRWVRDVDQGAEAARFFAAHCDRVRVMPFLEGVPCSIHGFVFPNYVAALRPCEMLVFRRPGQASQRAVAKQSERSKESAPAVERRGNPPDSLSFSAAGALLAYAGAGTFWDPPAADREVMRGAVRRVGAYLRATVGYQGSFTLDGMMTADGFRPTEINPRYGAALGIMAGGVPDLPTYLLHLALAEGEPFEWHPEALEALLLDSGDAHRRGQGHQMFTRKIHETETLDVVNDHTGWRVAAQGEPAHARLLLGPGPMGGFVRALLEPAHTPVGPSAAPRLAEVLAFADRHWQLGLGPLEPARSVRH